MYYYYCWFWGEIWPVHFSAGFNKTACQYNSHINVDRFDGVDMDVGGRGRAIPLAKLVAVILFSLSKWLRDRDGFRRGHSRVAQRPGGKKKLVLYHSATNALMHHVTVYPKMRNLYLCSHLFSLYELYISISVIEFWKNSPTQWTRMEGSKGTSLTTGWCPLMMPPPG